MSCSLTAESGGLNMQQNMQTIYHLNKCGNLNLLPKASKVFCRLDFSFNLQFETDGSKSAADFPYWMKFYICAAAKLSWILIPPQVGTSWVGRRQMGGDKPTLCKRQFFQIVRNFFRGNLSSWNLRKMSFLRFMGGEKDFLATTLPLISWFNVTKSLEFTFSNKARELPNVRQLLLFKKIGRLG